MVDKLQAMESLRDEADSLTEDIRDPGVRLVWGEGSLDSGLAIVGEAPGGVEDRTGRPFVGPAGKLLEAELQAAGVSRADVYITNVVKCRSVSRDKGRASNRTPTPKEISGWRDLLTRELEIVRPHVVLCLGAIAASALIHPAFRMTAERGAWFDGPLGSRIAATYHPSYVLRSIAYRSGQVLDEFRSDLEAAIEAAHV